MFFISRIFCLESVLCFALASVSFAYEAGDVAERLVVRKITFNGRERGAGSYNASKGYVGSWLAGTGELVILEGKGPGFQMTVR